MPQCLSINFTLVFLSLSVLQRPHSTHMQVWAIHACVQFCIKTLAHMHALLLFVVHFTQTQHALLGAKTMWEQNNKRNKDESVRIKQDT